jgi:hypothetical protein
MTGKADDLQRRFQNFKIVGWRYPAQRFSLNHYPILEQVFAAGIRQQLSFCREAPLDLSRAFYPALVSCDFVADQCSVFQYGFNSVL